MIPEESPTPSERLDSNRKLSMEKVPFALLITAYISLTLIGATFIFVQSSAENYLPVTPEVEHPYNFEITRNDFFNKTNSFHVKVTMLSKTFSAASPIKVKVQVEQMNGSDVKDVWVIFPRSHYPADMTIDDFDQGKALYFTNPVNRVFAPETTEIMYQIQGCYNVVPTTANLVYPNIYDPNVCSEIHIDSLEATYAYAANRNAEHAANQSLYEAKLATKLTYMLIGYAGITGGYEAYRAYINNKSRKKTISNNPD